MRGGRPPAGWKDGAAAVAVAAMAIAGTAAVALLSACGGGATGDLRAEERADPGRLVIFVYDRSTSIPDYQLELARKLTARRIRDLGHGDRIAALEVLQRSLSEPPKRWSETIPRKEMADRELASDSVALARFLSDALAYLARFSEPEDRDQINGTDILSTFHDVAEELRPFRDREAVLYMFSDMLQSDPHMEMEGLRKMPADEWVELRATDGRLPDLTGLCVVAVGPRVDTEEGQRVKEFWREYFDATGAVLLDGNYAYRPVALPARPCP